MAIIDPSELVVLSKYFPGLTDNKLAIFLLFGYGLTKKEIAADLEINERTVTRALNDMVEQYGISNPDMLRVIAGNKLKLILLTYLIRR
ncbi:MULTISPECIES: helix-turn-helix transcriptional regulator [unclassified Enterobacter]|uniref:helix-turn-helix transcriptional regulator n=1 Tax=unclassified Enterobacter TaxID=2608935 RepID=UPI003B432F1F